MDYPGFGLSEGLHGYIPSLNQLVDDVIEHYAKVKGDNIYICLIYVYSQNYEIIQYMFNFFFFGVYGCGRKPRVQISSELPLWRIIGRSRSSEDSPKAAKCVERSVSCCAYVQSTHLNRRSSYWKVKYVDTIPKAFRVTRVSVS